MKKVYVLSVLLLFVCFGAFAQCGVNEIELRKDGKRDWGRDYNDLRMRIGNNDNINSLRSFFYNADQAKSCISIADVHKLEEQLEKIAALYPTEKIVVNFKNAVKSIAVANPIAAANQQLPESSPNTLPESTVNAGIDSTVTDGAIMETQPTADESFSWKWLAIGFGVLALALGGFLIYETKRLKKLAELRMEQINELGKRKSAGERSDFQRENSLKSDAQSWKDKYLKLDHAHRATVAELDKYKHGKSQPMAAKMAPKPEQKAQIQPIAKTEPPFYLSNPTATEDGAGIFKDVRQTQINPANSFYKFIVNADEKTARFWFIDNQNIVESALVYPESFIDPACEYQSFNSGAKNIKTNQPGIAEKQGENWKIVQKAKITFA